MKMEKAPGRDGFTVEFYKDAWPTVKQSVINSIQTFFATCFMPKFFNSTTITWIPKVPNPVQMGDFRPISCCNSIYKCITIILASRLKRTLNSVVGTQQTTYVSGRSIVDAWFSISIKGSLQSHFKSSKGLRHGDPLSPYLFIIVMECFFELEKIYIAKDKFDFHTRCKEIDLVNLSFADDLFILCAATEVSLKLIRSALRMFGNLSGLHLNSSKRFFYFAGVSQVEEKNLCENLGISASSLPVNDCRVLVDKIKHKIEGWGSKHLSYTGRVVLINYVICGVYNYCQVTDFVVRFVRKVKWPCGRRFTENRTCKEMKPMDFREMDDVLMWFGSEEYHTSIVWDVIRDKPGKIWWWKLVWYNGNVPKFNFTNWMLCLDKLPTKNRLFGWNLVDNDTCVIVKPLRQINIYFSNAITQLVCGVSS
ncbi:hypothetical protein LIER_13873 [Lithospermum erythrorhizon]|uniref:Reverse transcriptase domain-containing protein n=1 Tax=Lithospermum erythrorhizon TaxID=34254 RepID=A0AAV3Q297_LITER